MLWFYYVLARSEEDRMEIRFGDAYRKVKQQTWRFLPREPGGFLQRHLFGWIPARKMRLATSYLCSLIVAIGIAFLLRGLSLAATSHMVLHTRKMGVQVMFGKGSVVHTMMDAGMTHEKAGHLNLTPSGMKLVFSKEAEGFGQRPFATRMRWQPALIVELSDRAVLS